MMAGTANLKETVVGSMLMRLAKTAVQLYI